MIDTIILLVSMLLVFLGLGIIALSIYVAVTK